MRREPKIHYAGALQYVHRGTWIDILPGWAACCSGPRAEKIRKARQNTYMRQCVTCLHCRMHLGRADAYCRRAVGRA